MLDQRLRPLAEQEAGLSCLGPGVQRPASGPAFTPSSAAVVVALPGEARPAVGQCEHGCRRAAAFPASSLPYPHLWPHVLVLRETLVQSHFIGEEKGPRRHTDLKVTH